MPRLKKVLKFSLLMIASLALIYATTFIIRKIRVEDNQAILTPHFVINYSGILRAEANDIYKALDANYARIRNELGDAEHHKISVFIHPTQKIFNKATGLINSKANGTSRGTLAFHLKYETWFNSVFPQDMKKVAVHEFTHWIQLNVLVQDALSKTTLTQTRDFDREFEDKFSKQYPQWLWEAISDYEAGIVNTMSVKHGMKNRPTLQQLNTSSQIYNVGYTIIEYLMNKYGKEKLPLFIKSYGDFKNELGVSEKDFESGWHKFVDEKYLE